MQFGKLKLKACRYGWMLFSGKYIGRCFDLYGEYSESEVSVLRDFLTEGYVAFDIGANIGDLTVPMARFVGNTGRVFAVESHPETFNVLCANLALNGIKNVKPINAYLTDSDDAPIEAGAWGAAAYTGETWEPNRMTLDSINVQRCDLIKIDVDGPELSILRGGAMLIEKHRPILYFENDDRQKSSELLNFVMNDLGYYAYWHAAPIFDPDNYFGNAENQWTPDRVVSLMVLAVPRERTQQIGGLQRIENKDQWWPNLAT